jgi:hypothetical protein
VANQPVLFVDPLGLLVALGPDSVQASFEQAILTRNVDKLKFLLQTLKDVNMEGNWPALENAARQIIQQEAKKAAAEAIAARTAAEAAKKAAQAAAKKTANQIIQESLKGSVRNVFPAEMLGKTLGEIQRLAAQGVPAAQTALKLLTQNEYKK